MKKPVKIVILGLVILGAITGGIYYVRLPVAVRMVRISLQVAELAFTEQGVVTAENTFQVYSAIHGKIESVHVREGQEVRAGDILLVVDDSGLRLQVEQVLSGIRSLQAQLAGVDVEAAATRSNLTSTRNMLQGELMAIDAQAAQSNQAYANRQELQNEQMRVQQILIDQQESVLEKAKENLERIYELYQAGVVARIDYEDASAAVETAEAGLEAAKGQMAIIIASAPESSGEHFEGLRASINAQIAGINQQLAQDTTESAKAHYEALIAIEQANVATLEREIENTIITAPVSGIVTTLQAQATNLVNSTTPVAEITVLGNMAIEVYVSTQDIGSIIIGDVVGLVQRRRSGDLEFTGRVIEIDSTAVVRLSALGVEERKVKLWIEPEFPENQEAGLGHGLDVIFYIFREEDKIVVPKTAVFQDGEQDMVWAVRGGDSGFVEVIPIVVGMELRTEIIVESGLNEGDYVISDANNPSMRVGRRVVAS